MLAEKQFDALVLQTHRMQQNLRAGAVMDLRASLLLRHRLLLVSDDVVNAFTLYKSIARFKSLGDGSFESQAALEAEAVFAPMVYFLNQDAEIFRAVRQDIVKMARDAMGADIQTLAAAVQKLAKDRTFYRDALQTLMNRRDVMRTRKSARLYH